jgi:hypothetical protein
MVAARLRLPIYVGVHPRERWGNLRVPSDGINILQSAVDLRVEDVRS